MRTFLLVLALWLVLNESLSAAHLLLGGAIAVAASLVLARLEPASRGARRPLAMARLAASVAADIVRSNIAVALIVLGLGRKGRTAGFLTMPVAVSSPEALAVMACIVTATPGTSWVRYDRTTRLLTIHVLDLLDEEEWIRLFKQRYECRLQEIFE